MYDVAYLNTLTKVNAMDKIVNINTHNIDLNKLSIYTHNILEKSSGVTVDIDSPTSLLQGIKNTTDGIGGSLKKIADFIDTVCKYCKNPFLLLIDLTIVVAKLSYPVCLFGCLWLLLVYIFTHDIKYLKKARAMGIIYFILQILGGCMQGTLT